MCTKFGRYAFFLSLMHSVWSQGPAQLTFSSNPVYSQELVTLTCGYSSASGVLLVSVTVDAFSGILSTDSLKCTSLGSQNCNGSGVFSGKSINGWPGVAAGSTNVNLTLTATPSLELNYTCTARFGDGNGYYNVTSAAVFLQVFVLPSPPIIVPNATTFNQSDNATISCESLNGKPAANITLTVSLPNGSTVASRGISSSSLVLPSPSMDWHETTATCIVWNHNFPNMTVTRRVMINHVRVTRIPNVLSTSLSTITLNCSAYVTSYPGVLYSWQASIGTNATFSSYPGNATFDVQPGQLGSFNCTATNIVTMDNVTITFIVSNVTSTTSSNVSPTNSPSSNYLWVIGLVLGIAAVVVIAVILGVLWKRGHFSKGNRKHDVQPTSSDQRSDKANSRGSVLYVYDGPASSKTSTDHRSDADAFDLVEQHAQASGKTVNRKGHTPSTPNIPTKDRHLAEDVRKSNRLVIAAEGIVSQLSQKTLQSVVLVEYSDQMCSLNDIFDKVRRVVPPSSLKFKSVALLLRPAKVGLTISVVDNAVLTASNIQEDKGEKVRGFISRIAEMCIDNHSSARLDILNYTGKAPLRLKQGLTDLLKINVTVSSDFFGVNTQTGPTEGHATVVDTYFDRTKTVEVVYADLEQLSAKPQVQPRKVEEGVLYTEIQRKA